MAVDGEDVLRFVRGLFDFFAQFDDEIVDGAVRRRGIDEAPDFLEDLVAGYGLTNSFEQQPK